MSVNQNYEYIRCRLQSVRSPGLDSLKKTPSALEVLSKPCVNSFPTEGGATPFSLPGTRTPGTLIPWSVPLVVEPKGANDFFGSATLIGSGRILYTFHQHEDIRKQHGNARCFIAVNSSQINQSHQWLKLSRKAKRFPGLDLVLGTVVPSQQNLIPNFKLSIAGRKVVGEHLTADEKLFFCGWGSNREQRVALNNPFKNDIVLTRAGKPIPPRIRCLWKQELEKRLGEELGPNWLDHHLWCIGENTGAYYSDSGGGLLMLADSKIYLLGVAVKMHRSMRKRHYSLFVSLTGLHLDTTAK